jgi:hypothetical protein
MIDEQALQARLNRAQEAFENYRFGEGFGCAEVGGWDASDPSDLTRIAYIQDLDDPDADSFRVSFHVTFTKAGAVDEVYALEMSGGTYFGAYFREVVS